MIINRLTINFLLWIYSMKKMALIVLILLPLAPHAAEVTVYPIDCASLERGDYGVAFRTKEFPKGKTYFSKGRAEVLCPKLLSGQGVSGHELTLPKDDERFSESERKVIKEFVITE